MRLGYIGLGKMGFAMVERLIEKGHQVVVFDQDQEAVREIALKGAESADSLQTLTSSLDKPCLVWLMIPYQAVDTVLDELILLLQDGDTIIDGGNSPFKESMRRAKQLVSHGIDFLDVGVSGGPSGARTGACIMAGGKKEVFEKYENLFRDLSAPGAYAYTGDAGSGHFVKMIHNGIEYGMMQAIAEGFALMKSSAFNLDLLRIADLYNHRSVIESRLLGWLRKAFETHGEDLNAISGAVAHSGEGQWTVETAREMNIPVPVIEDALNFRILSERNPGYAGKILSAMRNQFGGHEVFKSIQE
jgi:6-phosphogluconate dehydrogenase